MLLLLSVFFRLLLTTKLKMHVTRLPHVYTVTQSPAGINETPKIEQVHAFRVWLVLQASTNHSFHLLEIIRELARD
jgi:hypothetical protein